MSRVKLMKKSEKNKFKALITLSLFIKMAPGLVLGIASTWVPAYAGDESVNESTAPEILEYTHEQLAFLQNVCDPRVKKLQSDYAVIKNYYPILRRFANELEKKISNVTRHEVQEIRKTFKLLRDDMRKCKQLTLSKMTKEAQAICSSVENNPANNAETSGAIVQSYSDMFSLFLNEYNRGKPKKLQMRRVSSSDLFGFHAATTFIPAYTSIPASKILSGARAETRVFADDTLTEIEARMQDHLIGTENQFIFFHLQKDPICKSYVKLEKPFEAGAENPELKGLSAEEIDLVNESLKTNAPPAKPENAKTPAPVTKPQTPVENPKK